ncbi:MAG: type II secretion system protein [Planctomycetia bacterium]|nr:type II secretion system protein [Planctomycetia bacterium]
MRTKIRNPKSEIRNGFTLVELLMVITIIAILMSITIAVVGAFIGQARDSATTTTLSKIQSLMDSRRRAFDRLIQRKGFLTGSTEYIAAGPGFYGLQGQTQKIVAIKLLQVKYFPQSASDLNFLLQVYGANNAAKEQLALMYPKLFVQPLSNPPVVVPNLTNSEILYIVLTENVIGDTPIGQDAFSTAEFRTEAPPPSGGSMRTAGLPYFTDAWQNPIRFYRWPTRLFRSGGPGATPTAQDVANAKVTFSALPVFTGNLANDLQRDPDDPLQVCTNIVINGNTMNFESAFGAPAFHTPATFHMPLIVSAGADGYLGLAEPDAPDVAGSPAVLGRLASLNITATHTAQQAQDELSDNIVSASIKAGGK